MNAETEQKQEPKFAELFLRLMSTCVAVQLTNEDSHRRELILAGQTITTSMEKFEPLIKSILKTQLAQMIADMQMLPTWIRQCNPAASIGSRREEHPINGLDPASAIGAFGPYISTCRTCQKVIGFGLRIQQHLGGGVGLHPTENDVCWMCHLASIVRLQGFLPRCAAIGQTMRSIEHFQKMFTMGNRAFYPPMLDSSSCDLRQFCPEWTIIRKPPHTSSEEFGTEDRLVPFWARFIGFDTDQMGVIDYVTQY